MGEPSPATFARSARLPSLAKYEIIEELGHGGMATVYRARDPRLHRDVALKLIHPHLRDSQEVAHRFYVEAQAVAKLRHPNIVEVFDVSSETDEEQYLVVELLRGRTLRRVLQKHGPMPPEVAAALAVDLLGALDHAHHAGVVHRDVKPENVMLDGFGTASEREPLPRLSVKLMDFGIAKLLDAQGVTSTGQVLGSPAHMAPEQIEGGDVDARADVFGMGVLLYECMVGHLPFEGSNPAQVLRRVLDGVYASAERERPLVGKAWSTVLDRALAHDPAARFPSAAAMRQVIEAELERLKIEAPGELLASWSRDPAEVTREHDEAIAARLVELGAAARGTQDAVAAANDYNRALAYRPQDQRLLRLVSRMHRDEARARLLRRYAPLVLSVLVLGMASFFVTRSLRQRQVNSGVNPPPTSASAVASTTPPPRASIVPTAETPPPRPMAVPVVVPPRPQPPVRAVSRVLTITRLRPPFGVSVAVDAEPPAAAATGQKITLDGEAHTLRFTCVNDACEPDQRAIPAGDVDQGLEVALTIKPALLTVEGDGQSTYGVTEEPTVPVRPGIPARIPMKVGRVTVHVRELPSGVIRSAALVAGKETHINFVGASP